MQTQLCFGNLAAQVSLDPRGEPTVNQWSRYAIVQLKLERIHFEEGGDIPIWVRIENRGYQVIRIYPSALLNRSFRFFVMDKQGREIPQEFDFLNYQKRKQGARIVNLQGQEVKEVILAPQESFEKLFYLNDFYNLRVNREYRVALHFYPDYRQDFFARSENTPKLRIISAVQQSQVDSQQTFEPRELRLKPEETVYLFLSAELQEKWEDYLKYLHLKQYINAYNSYAYRYKQALPSQRYELLKEFSLYLTTRPSGKIKNFRILGAEPERNASGAVMEGGPYFVRAIILRESNGQQAKYEYLYTLQPQAGGLWKIVDVEAKIIRS